MEISSSKIIYDINAFIIKMVYFMTVPTNGNHKKFN